MKCSLSFKKHVNCNVNMWDLIAIYLSLFLLCNCVSCIVCYPPKSSETQAAAHAHSSNDNSVPNLPFPTCNSSGEIPLNI